MVRASSLWKLCDERRSDIAAIPVNELKPVPEGTVTLGRPHDHTLWGWDVDYGTHVAHVKPFNASKYLVSNGEYHQFIAAGGYETRSHWTQDGWEWVTWKKARHPLFWIPIYAPTSDASAADATPAAPGRIIGYRYRAYAEEIDMPWDWPVDINQLEAKAFCNWKASTTGRSIRLPTEEEYIQLREHVWPETSAHREDQATWPVAPGNINLEHYSSSCPVDKFALGGFYDVIGNVWQHTETPVVPFNGFRTHPIYDDFSVPTFDTRHNMIMGGSWISTGNEATRHARYRSILACDCLSFMLITSYDE
jgi:5-histidylcysteine sulfoxide synthase